MGGDEQRMVNLMFGRLAHVQILTSDNNQCAFIWSGEDVDVEKHGCGLTSKRRGVKV